MSEIVTDEQALDKKVARVLDNTRLSSKSEMEVGALVIEKLTQGPSPETRLFTAEEVLAAVRAVAKAERFPSGPTIMAHIQADDDLTPDTADAVRKIVVAAYIDLLVGDRE